MSSTLKMKYSLVFILSFTTFTFINKFNINRLLNENFCSIGRFNSSTNSPPFLEEESFEPFKLSFTNSSFYEVMQHRIKYIQDACKRINPPTASLGFWENKEKGVWTEPPMIYILRKEQIAWCPVPKAASTSWKINLLHLRASNEQIAEVIKLVSLPPKPPPTLRTNTVTELLF